MIFQEEQQDGLWAGEGKLEGYGKFIGKIKDNKGKQLYDFSEWLAHLFIEKKPDLVIIEKPFRGRNSNVLAHLSKFVAVAQLTAYRVLKLEIQPECFLDPRAIKRGLKVKKGRDHNGNKKIMVKRINSLYGLHLKFRKNKAKSYNDDDEADAIAVLTAWWLLKGYK